MTKKTGFKKKKKKLMTEMTEMAEEKINFQSILKNCLKTL